MANYKVTGYCNDENIYATKVTYIGVTQTHCYGDSHLGSYDEFTISYPVEDRSVTFTAVPKEGSSFVKWVYRVGSTSASEQTSTDNPFRYSEHKDIYIRAVGKKDSGGDLPDIPGGDWERYEASDLGIVMAGTPAIRSFGMDTAKCVYAYPVKFNFDGIANILAFSATDRIISYISTSTAFDSQNGKPIDYEYFGECDNWKNCAYSARVVKDVQYYVWFREENGDTVTEGEFVISAYIPKWDWNVSTSSDTTDEEVQTAYNAVKNKRSTASFSHNIWNALTNRVYDIIQHKSVGWDKTYCTYSNTKMDNGDYTLTAKKFNSLRYNIGIYYSTGIDEIRPGDVVYGQYFLTLAEKINAWIDTLTLE